MPNSYPGRAGTAVATGTAAAAAAAADVVATSTIAVVRNRTAARRAARRPAPFASAAAAGSRVISNVEPLENRTLMAANFFVATTGLDSNPGTIEQPFRTIQKAADVARAGDTVNIRGGTYRETVTPRNSGTSSARIVFKAYRDENVTVSGADVVTGWANHKDAVYRAPQSWDLGFGLNQVFVDGRMMTEARWPNTTLDLSKPVKARADNITATYAGADSHATLYDDALKLPAGAWDGASINIAAGQQWYNQTGTVTSSGPGKLTFDYAQRVYNGSERYETPKAGNPYFLTGKFVALDAPTEWFRDPANGRLYLWTQNGDNPAGHVVEAKRRNHAFNLSNRSFIDVEGLNFFAATVNSNGASSDLRLVKLNFNYVSHHQEMDMGSGPMSGVVLSGKRNLLEKSTVANSAGTGVWLIGSDHVVRNNVIRDTNYMGGHEAAVIISGHKQTVTRNTIYNTGRSGVKHGKATAAKITYNVIHDVMLQTTDGGGTYAFGTDGQGTEIAYNVIYNARAGGFGAGGVYLDNGCSNFSVHHNVVYNADTAFKLNPTSRNLNVYNNTFVGSKLAVGTSQSRDMLGSTFTNNIFVKEAQLGPGHTAANNLKADPAQVNGLFINPAQGNYQLRNGSAAIDAGRIVAGGAAHAGVAPDQGAYEFGKPAFEAGAGTGVGTTPPPTPTPTPAPTPTPTPTPTPSPTPAPTAKRNARSPIEAEGYDAGGGIVKKPTWIGFLSEGDWVKYGGVDFGTGGINTVQVKIALPAEYAGGRVEFRTGSPTGPLAGTLMTKGTGGWTTYATQSATVSGVTGVKDVYLVFRGEAVGNVDAFTFGTATTGAVRSARSHIQAESFDTMAGVQRGRSMIGYLNHGDWVRFGKVDFGAGVKTMKTHIAVGDGHDGMTVEAYVGSPTGKKIATLKTDSTGGWGWDHLETQSTAASGAWGVQDVYLIFKGGDGIGNVDWISFA